MTEQLDNYAQILKNRRELVAAFSLWINLPEDTKSPLIEAAGQATDDEVMDDFLQILGWAGTDVFVDESPAVSPAQPELPTGLYL